MNQFPSVLSQEILTNYLSKTEIVQDTAEQIKKDFGMFGLEITFSGNTTNAYHELHQQLIAIIENLLRNSYTKLISVLYRIDLTEEDLMKGEKELVHYNQVEAMAHLIIARELKKVLSRKFYK